MSQLLNIHFCDYRRAFLQALCFFLLGGVSAQLEAQILEKEKISEGQYVRMKNGDKIPGSEQSWTLWRFPGVGYELEDHFELAPNPAAQLLSQMPSKDLSPELRRELAAEVKQTDLIVRYGMDRTPMSISIQGKKLQDGTKVDVVKCRVDGNQVRCDGNIRQTKFRGREQRELFYAMPFPMLLSMWLLPDTLKTETMQRQLVVLEFGKVYEFQEAEETIQPLGDETITIGDHKFEAHRVQVRLKFESGKKLDLAIWHATPGLVFAMETPSFPNERIALVKYKKYSDF